MTTNPLMRPGDDPSTPRQPNETDEQYGARLREAEAAKEESTDAEDAGTTSETGTDESPDA